MIHTLHIEHDLIYAYVVFRTVDERGVAKNDGEYIYIEDMWIHPYWHHHGVLQKLIENIDKNPECANAKYVYWIKRRTQKNTGPFSRNRFFKTGVLYG